MYSFPSASHSSAPRPRVKMTGGRGSPTTACGGRTWRRARSAISLIRLQRLFYGLELRGLADRLRAELVPVARLAPAGEGAVRVEAAVRVDPDRAGVERPGHPLGLRGVARP